MKLAKVKFSSVSPYSQSRRIMTQRNERETADEHEKRCWRERMHTTADGEVFIPPMCFKHALDEAIKRLAIPIKGRGKANYTKVFQAGQLVVEPLMLGVRAEDVEGEWLFVPADGVPGSGKRVDKCFQVIREWGGVVEYHVLDDLISQDVFEHGMKAAGQIVGIGRFRPMNRGYYGRFDAEVTAWEEY